MSSSTTVPSLSLPKAAPAAARAALGLLRQLRSGTLDLQLPDGTQMRFGSGAKHEPRGAMRLRNWKVCGAALRSGDIGFAECFIDEDWSSPDLVELLKVFIANREAVESAIYGSLWGSLLYRIKHLLNGNSRRGSRKNIHAHYDLGNPFYKLWLDETMSYSAAWFQGDLGVSWRRRNGPRCSARWTNAGCSRVSACSRSAAAGAAWPSTRRATSAPMSPASRCPPSS